ncbi:hypothetical protein QF030_000347 [Streptomyces rishiriensis]|uniref:Uncharacterized protein n=1 Tax=Streptomyces rishiriensis TaxID=68264 RepID=A0ABU0NGD7_STRRH|nr:hypothetical protein [Streptomyces rishiriensis]
MRPGACSTSAMKSAQRQTRTGHTRLRRPGNAWYPAECGAAGSRRRGRRPQVPAQSNRRVWSRSCLASASPRCTGKASNVTAGSTTSLLTENFTSSCTGRHVSWVPGAGAAQAGPPPNLAVITIPRPTAAPCHRLPGSRGGTVSGCPGVHVAVIRCRRAAVRSCTRPGDLGENPVQQHVTGMGGPECTGRPGDGCAQTTGHRVDPGISGIPADTQAGRELPQCVVLTGAVNARREGRGPTMPITFTLTPPTT